MSKGINIFNHFNPPKKDGHIIKSYDVAQCPIMYCPKLKDDTTGQHTSNGVMCTHCKKHI